MVGIIERLKRGPQKRYYTTAILRYSGDGLWRIGLKPQHESRLEWIECLPFNQVLEIVQKLEKGIVRTGMKEDG
jgi:hypothetical protein